MPRPSQSRQLAILMNGLPVGQWTLRRGNEHAFSYAPSWLTTPGARPISLSMPLIPDGESYRGELVQSFFDNLLPDSADIRRRLQRRFGADSTSAFDLLGEIGRDCVGALQIVPVDQKPLDVRRIEADALSDSDVAEELRKVTQSPVFGQRDDDAFRISLAGAQEKSAFLSHNGGWHRPRGATPTSHIFKLPLGTVGNMRADLSTSVENEWLCRQLMFELGLPIADCSIADFEDQHVLVVERFDRRLADDGSWWIRLPQEDICQATGVPPDKKYDSDGGPGIAATANLLLGSRTAEADRRTFLKSQIAFWMLCAIDGHAKNFSVRLEQFGRYSLAPLYDVMSAYPILGGGANQLAPQRAKMAMAAIGKNRHYNWSEIQVRHWESTARHVGLAATVGEDLADLASRANDAIDAVSAALPVGFPLSVLEPVFEGLQSKATDILNHLS